jgi:hypothetical protein
MKARLKKGSLLVMACLFSVSLFSQYLLIARHTRSYQKVSILPGEFVRLKLKQGQWVQGKVYLDSSQLMVDQQLIPMDSIDKINYSKNRYGFRLIDKVFTTFGLLYLGVTTFNRTINEDSPILYRPNLITGGSFFLIGTVFRKLNFKTLSTKKYTVTILDISP